MIKNHGHEHVFGHNSGPWARRGMKMGPYEFFDPKLTSYGGPGVRALQKDVTFKVQRFCKKQFFFARKTGTQKRSELGPQFAPRAENLLAPSHGCPACFLSPPGARGSKINAFFRFSDFFRTPPGDNFSHTYDDLYLAL